MISSVWVFLKHNNLLPYIAMGVMGYVIYILWAGNIEKDLQLEQAKVNFETMQDAWNTKTLYHDEMLKQIQNTLNERWKEGRHVEILTYTVDTDN